MSVPKVVSPYSTMSPLKNMMNVEVKLSDKFMKGKYLTLNFVKFISAS